jgi:DHA1 family multidrug resistance protein-like MFS transporter
LKPGPLIGGFITKSYLGWRWTQYIPAFMAFSCAIGALFLLDESYPPIILVSKASELRRLTRNWGIHAKQEEVEVDLKELVTKNVSRPLRILFQEPIVLLVSIYVSLSLPIEGWRRRTRLLTQLRSCSRYHNM